MSIEAMKQALEALDSDNPDIQLRAATTLRIAIEQAEKPVECMCGVCKLGKREWVGLTEIEIGDIETADLLSDNWDIFSFARAIEAKLKEKNHD
jgi:hypothetical protein